MLSENYNLGVYGLIGSLQIRGSQFCQNCKKRLSTILKYVFFYFILFFVKIHNFWKHCRKLVFCYYIPWFMPIPKISHLSFYIIFHSGCLPYWSKLKPFLSLLRLPILSNQISSEDVWTEPHRNNWTDFWHSLLFLRNAFMKSTMPVCIVLC